MWGFRVCDGVEQEVAWPEGLNATDEEAAARVTFFVVSGGADLAVSRASADYEHAEWHLVVPGTGHAELQTAEATRVAILENLGRPSG